MAISRSPSHMPNVKPPFEASPLDTELAYLAIHGALHLCGLDDHTEEEADEMRHRMSRAAVAIGLRPTKPGALSFMRVPEVEKAGGS
jgi:hypothetical protein